MSLWVYLLWLVGAYLVGSIPFGLLLGRLKGVDIRAHGSGNVGATNAGRVLGRKIGLLCFGLDVLKGLGPVLGFGLWTGAMGLIRGDAGQMTWVWTTGGPDDASMLDWQVPIITWLTVLWLAIAAAAVVGHVFPVWLRFKGGKGVATSLGVLLGVFPYLSLPAVAGFVVWYATVKLSGYVGLASVVAAVALPVLTLISALAFGLETGPAAVFVAVTALLAVLVVYRHKGNLQRIRAGTEAKAGWATKNKDE
jgi:glycerol-3-phosphate acyltransferase PlsY